MRLKGEAFEASALEFFEITDCLEQACSRIETGRQLDGTIVTGTFTCCRGRILALFFGQIGLSTSMNTIVSLKG